VSLSREAAQALETGRWDGLVARALASAFAPLAARGLVRPAIVPPEVGLVCVGGATLGGSGKTRLAIACARELASKGARVVLVGHAYRAAPPSSRVVRGDERLEDVGDEALVCARALAQSNVPVVVGPSRQAAIDHAVGLSSHPEVLVLDGPLGIRGRSRSRTLSLLAVDANRPWGSGRLPPAGDLRAMREVLLAQADHVVPVDAAPVEVHWQDGDPVPSRSEKTDDSVPALSWGRSATAPIASLRGATLGLFTAIARPDRLVRALAAAGIRPREIVSVADHGPRTSVGARLRQARVDAWVGTPKCSLHLAGVSLGVPFGILEGDVPLAPRLVQALAGLGLPPSPPGPSSSA
jgi:tetraacyldisaccharide 4'-kinase